MAEQWDLLFTLPNLAPPIPTPFASDGYVICSGKDPRLKACAECGQCDVAEDVEKVQHCAGATVSARMLPDSGRYSDRVWAGRDDQSFSKRVRVRDVYRFVRES